MIASSKPLPPFRPLFPRAVLLSSRRRPHPRRRVCPPCSPQRPAAHPCRPGAFPPATPVEAQRRMRAVASMANPDGSKSRNDYVRDMQGQTEIRRRSSSRSSHHLNPAWPSPSRAESSMDPMPTSYAARPLCTTRCRGDSGTPTQKRFAGLRCEYLCNVTIHSMTRPIYRTAGSRRAIANRTIVYASRQRTNIIVIVKPGHYASRCRSQERNPRSIRFDAAGCNALTRTHFPRPLVASRSSRPTTVHNSLRSGPS